MPSALKNLSTTAALCLCFSALNACQQVPNTPAHSPSNASTNTAPVSAITLEKTPPKASTSAAMAAALKAAKPFANIVSFEQEGFPIKDAGQLEMEIQWPEPDFAIQVIPSSTTRLRVRISGGNQAAIEENLTRPLGSVISAYRLIFLSLPSGTNRTIEVDAYDSADKLVATGQVRNVTIQAQQFNRQNITLLPVSGVQPTPPPSGGGGGGGGGGGTPVNRPPVIGGINQNLLLNGADYNGTLSAAASDPEGRPLTYNWSSSAGSFVSNTAAEPQWSGPAGTHTFSLTVSDGVRTTSYSQEITLSPNAPPVVTLMRIKAWSCRPAATVACSMSWPVILSQNRSPTSGKPVKAALSITRAPRLAGPGLRAITPLMSRFLTAPTPRVFYAPLICPAMKPRWWWA